MSIEFSKHALEQLKSRKISKKRVLVTVTQPDKKLKSTRNRRLRQKRFGSKILEVVTVTEGSKITVITNYYKEKNED